MFSLSSGAYNGYPTQLYGGLTSGGRTSGGRVPLPWESTLDFDTVWGGKTHRKHKKATKKQLAALAKGRAILKAKRKHKRRYVGAAIRNFLGGAKSSSLDDFASPGRKALSQSSIDSAALEFQRLKSKLDDDFDIFSNPDEIVPAAYPTVKKLSNLANFLRRGQNMGYDNSYGISTELTPQQKQTLSKYQKANLMAGESVEITPSMMRFMRNYLKQEGRAQPSRKEIMAAIKKGKRGMMKEAYDDEVFIPARNPWEEVKQEDLQ